VVVADKEINKDLISFATGKKIPVLDYQEDFADAYEAFYEQLFPEEAE
jgi:starch synthase